MPPDVLKYLFDVRQACLLIQEFAQAKSLGEYEHDRMLRSAIERQFIIVGEALSQCIRLQPEIEIHIADARRIVNFRNVIVHGYARVEAATVWGIVERYIPALLAEIEPLLPDNPP